MLKRSRLASVALVAVGAALGCEYPPGPGTSTRYRPRLPA